MQEMNTENLANFYKRSKKELNDFWDIFQWDCVIDDQLLSEKTENPNHRMLFLETCYTYRVDQVDVLRYQSFLQKRIADIELIVDHYFNLLEPVLIKKMKDKFKRERLKKKKEGKEGSLKEQVQ